MESCCGTSRDGTRRLPTRKRRPRFRTRGRGQRCGPELGTRSKSRSSTISTTRSSLTRSSRKATRRIPASAATSRIRCCFTRRATISRTASTDPAPQIYIFTERTRIPTAWETTCWYRFFRTRAKTSKRSGPRPSTRCSTHPRFLRHGPTCLRSIARSKRGW